MEWPVLIIIGFVLWYWWDSLQAKEAARLAGLNKCRNVSVQFLDDTVAMKKIWFQRDSNGRFQICRLYYFEFSSDGTQRYKGSITMLGKKIRDVEMEAYRIPTDLD